MKLYIIEWEENVVMFNKPEEPHIEKEVSYYLRDKLLECETSKVQEVINEILNFKD